METKIDMDITPEKLIIEPTTRCNFKCEHTYQTMRLGHTKMVNSKNFGNVLEKDPLSIWNSPDYSRFRKNVKKYDYPNCHSWCETRCDYVLNDPFYQDCFINDIPCCDCHWNLGFLNCLN